MSEPFLLIVEDNPDDEALVLRALRKNHLEVRVHVASDGVEALDFLFGPGTEPGALPDLVLLDLMMPRVDGFQVLERIRADPRTRTVPVVIFSSSNEPGDVERSYALGASSFVRKPVEFGEFAEAVRVIGEYWLRLNLVPTAGPERTMASPASAEFATPSG